MELQVRRMSQQVIEELSGGWMDDWLVGSEMRVSWWDVSREERANQSRQQAGAIIPHSISPAVLHFPDLISRSETIQ